MGSAPSKEGQSPNQQAFAVDHPVQFSEGLLDSLQNSAETDSTRARNLELIIQQRVSSELEKHLKASSERLATLSESISKEPVPQQNDQPKKPSPSWTDKPLITRIAEKLRGESQTEADQSIAKAGIDRNAVSKEIASLKEKLDSRKQKVEMDKDVERAKEEVIICLRKNDRRPLDCWQEVEKFKQEVGRLERTFVDKNAG